VAEYTRATLEAAQQSVEAQRTAEVGDARNGGGGSGSGWDCGQQWQRHAAAAPPAASLTRAVYSMQPARIARTAAGSGGRAGPGLPVPTSLVSLRRAPRVHVFLPLPSCPAPALPPSRRAIALTPASSRAPPLPVQLVLAVTVGAAAVAAVRARMRSIRECGACRGYGVKRCRLCSGRGSIEWEGKMAHREPCPLCLGRRFNPCTCCGGGPFLARNLFTHKNSGSEAGLVAQLASLTESASLRQRRAWPLGLGRLRPRGGGADNDERIENSDKLAEQIMMD
jgi:hypothetical protein